MADETSFTNPLEGEEASQPSTDPSEALADTGEGIGTAAPDGSEVVAAPTEPADWLALIPENVGWQYRPLEGSDELVVTLSPGKAFFMSMAPFNRNILAIADKGDSYFTLRGRLTAKAIAGFARASGFQKVLFIGSSKAGYGAMLLSGTCAMLDRRRAYYCVAFSPQTRLHPFNENIANLPSYKNLIKRASRIRGNKVWLERHGDLKFIERIRNLFVTIVYSEHFEQDVIEANYVCAPNIRKYPVPYTMHASIMPFSLHGIDEDGVRLRIKQLYRTRSADEDLAATMPDEWEQLVNWIVANKWVPSLMDLVNDTFRVNIFGAGPPLP